MKLLSDFHNLLLPELPGCSTGMVDLHLVLWAREFCSTTHAWAGDFDAITTVADQAAYDLGSPETQSEAVKVIRLTLDDELLYDARWNHDSQGDAPKYDAADPPFSMSESGTVLTLLEDDVPTAAGTMEVYGSMRPKTTATHLPDLFLNEYAEALRMGMLSRLMVMPKKPWSNPELAAFYRGEAHQLAQFASTQSRRGNTRGPLRSRKWF